MSVLTLIVNYEKDSNRPVWIRRRVKELILGAQVHFLISL